MTGCCCSTKCAKWATIIISVVALVLGIILAVLWERLYKQVVNHQLSIADRSTRGFKNWQETPIPMYLEIHLFNWTNPDEVEKYPGVKPSFVELGPYMFYEHHIKENITFNNNDTVTFLNKRTWSFRPELSVGSLDDKVSILNPIAMVVTNQIKNEHYLVKRAVNFFFEDKGETLAVTKTVQELLFDGYEDPLLDIALKLNISGLNLPFKRFGWFVDRNGSAPYDGVFNMYDGGNDFSKLGLITEWNYQHQTKYYPGDCGIVNGTSGELWYPPYDDEEVSIFSSDLCSGQQVNLEFDNYFPITFKESDGSEQSVQEEMVLDWVPLPLSENEMSCESADPLPASKSVVSQPLLQGDMFVDQEEPFNASNVKLHRNGTDSVQGIEGNRYTGQADVFDNGTTYNSSSCFASGMRTGVRDVSSCKFGAPAYMSFPHFYLADPVYLQSVDGMSPNPDIHSTRIALEPSTGLPLSVYAAFQINMLMRNVEGIDMLSHVKDTLMPCFWFVQKAEISESLSHQAKTLLLFEKLGTYSGYGLIGLGGLLLGVFLFLTFRTRWKSNDEEQLLNHQTP